MSKLCTSGEQFQNYSQVVKNVSIIHKWLKCQYFIQVVKNGKIIHKWVKM
jgi:hypothetical protein